MNGLITAFERSTEVECNRLFAVTRAIGIDIALYHPDQFRVVGLKPMATDHHLNGLARRNAQAVGISENPRHLTDPRQGRVRCGPSIAA